MKTLNEHVAVAPIELDHNKGKSERVVAGFSGTDKTVRTLITGKVVFDSKSFKAGQTLYFKSELSRMPFFNEKLIAKQGDDQVEFILVPESFAVGVND